MTGRVTIALLNPTWIYVGVVYAIVVALARRGGNPLPKRIAALFYILIVIFFFKAMTGPYVSIATDIPRLIAPWSSTGPALTKYTVRNMETHDVVMQLVPWAHQVREAWRSGHVPLWNALAGCGYPLLANAQSAALSPLRLLALPLPLAYAMTAEAAMKIFIALTFTFLYCRRRYGTLPSSIAAMAYGFGPFVVAWLHFAQSTAACFLPAVLYQIDLIVERRTYPRFAMTAVIGAMVVFCGHPETAVHILLFAIAYILWIVIVERRRDFLPALAGAGVVAVLLALPIIVPFAENVRESTRFESQRMSGSEMPFSDFPSLALLVQPRLYGTRPGNPWGPATAEAVTGFAGILGIAAIIAIAIDTIARRRFREREVFFVLAAIGVLALLASFRPAVVALHAVIGLAANARLRFVLAWLLTGLIAAALDRMPRVPFAIGLASAAALIALIIARTSFPNDAARHDGLVSVIPSIVVLAIAALLLAPRLRTVASLLLVAAVVAEMWPLTIGWNSPFPTSTFYPRTPLIDAVLRYHRPGFDRVAGIGGVLFPNTNAMFGIEDARIHDPMEPARFVHLIDGVISHDYYKKWLDESTPLLDRLNVRWLMTEPGHELKDTTRYVLRYAGADGRLYENLHVFPRFFSPDAHVRIVAASGDGYTLEVDAAKPTIVMSSVGWSKWWDVSFRNGGAMNSEHHPPMTSEHYPPMSSPPYPIERSGVQVRGVTTKTPSFAFGTFSPAKGAGEKDSRLKASVEKDTQLPASVEKDSRLKASVEKDTQLPASVEKDSRLQPSVDSLTFGRTADRRLAMKADPFLSFSVPAGHTTISIRYVPVSFYIAALISLLTAAVLVCFMIRARVQRHMDLRRRAVRDRDRLRPALESDGP